MSIIAYTGLPGSGKSYSVVKHQILPALKLGRTVVTNVPLNQKAIREDVRSGTIIEFDVEKVQAEPHLIDEYAVPGCVLVLDELWRLFPAGEKVNHVPEPFKSLLAEHRHRVDAEGRSMQIVFVTQSVNQIGAFARQLVEQTIITTKLTDVGLSGRYRVDVYRQAMPVERAHVQNAIRSIQAQKYDKRIFAYYTSHTMRETDEVKDVDEGAMDARGSFLRRPLFVVGPVFIVLVLVFAVPRIVGVISGEVSLAGKPAAPASPITAPIHQLSPPRVAVQSPAQLVSPAKVAPPSYRLIGFVRMDESGGGIAVIEDSGQQAYVPLKDCHAYAGDHYQCIYRGWLVSSVGTLEPAAPPSSMQASFQL